jgi:hypothetical protein
MAKKSKSGTAKKSTVVKKPGAAMAAHSKDAGKQASAKSASKKLPAKAATSKAPAAAKRSASKSSKGSTSMAGKVLDTVKATASGAVNLAGSLIGRKS